jgi:tripartite-type tricarboxylate transporter receptor subunit TctC
MIEAGYADFVSVVWYAVMAPAGTPAPLRATLADTIGRVLREPEVVARLAQLGNEPAPTTPEATAALLAAETQRWSRVIRAAGIRPE